MIAESKSNKWR